MSVLSTVIDAVSNPLMPKPPAHEVLAVRLQEAQEAVPALVAAHEAANYDFETFGSPESANILAAATQALADGRDRVGRLTLALATAQGRAATQAAKDRVAAFTAAEKALAAHLKTRDHHLRSAAGHLSSYVKHWHGAIAATIQIAEGMTKLGIRPPQGAMLSVHEIRTVIEDEIHRANSEADPVHSARPAYNRAPPGAKSHNLLTQFNGRTLSAIAAVLAEKTAYTLRMVAAGRPDPNVPEKLKPVAPVAPGSVPLSTVGHDLSVSTVPPPEPQRTASETVLADMQATYKATPPVNPGEQPIEHWKEVWATIRPASVLDPDAYVELDDEAEVLPTVDELTAPELSTVDEIREGTDE
jgi:hypothetical protein